MASSSTDPRHLVRRVEARRTRWRGATAALACALPALALYGALILWPLLRLAVLSLQQWDGLTDPAFSGLDNYRAILADPGVGVELQHTLLWLTVTLAVPVLLGLGLALLLRGLPAALRTPLRALLVLPLVFPTVLIAVTWKLFYNPLSGPLTSTLNALHLGNLAQDWLGDPAVALPALLIPACWASFGLAMLLCEAALAGISPAVLAAAEIDGAGAWARLWWISLPELRGALPLATVVTGLCAVPSYDLVRLMTNGGPGYATTTIPFDAYGRAFGGLGQVGEAAALACLQSVVGLVLAGAALLAVRRRGRGEGDGESNSHSRPVARASCWAAGILGLVATAITVAPLAWLVVLSLRPSDGTGWWTMLRANLATLGSQGFGGAMLTSLGLALIVGAATLALALPPAFALALSRSRMLAVTAAMVLVLGLFQPAAVLIIPLFYTLVSFHLLDTTAGIVLPQIARALPIAILLLWAGFRALPTGVLEAAAIDGAAPRQILRHIAVPLALPLVAVVGVWAFLTSWNDYLLPTVIIQDESLQTVPVALGHFIGRFDTQYALLATGAVLAAAPLLVLYAALYAGAARGLSRLAPRYAERITTRRPF